MIVLRKLGLLACLSTVLCLSLVGCGKNTSQSVDDKSPNTTEISAVSYANNDIFVIKSIEADSKFVVALTQTSDSDSNWSISSANNANITDKGIVDITSGIDTEIAQYIPVGSGADNVKYVKWYEFDAIDGDTLTVKNLDESIVYDIDVKTTDDGELYTEKLMRKPSDERAGRSSESATTGD